MGIDKAYDILDTEYHSYIKKSHAAEAIKREEDINKVIAYLEDAKRYRDLLLFVCGINFGLRCGDLLKLHVGDLVDPDGNVIHQFSIIEEKTNKIRTLAVGSAVLHALDLYIKEMYKDNPIDRRDYLFTSVAHRDKFHEPKPLTVRSTERILKEVINEKCGINVHASTHLMRKTFAYHFLMKAPDRNRALELLCMQLNHSDIAYTLRYIGITQQEILETCFNLNLGYGMKEVTEDNFTNVMDLSKLKVTSIDQAN